MSHCTVCLGVVLTIAAVRALTAIKVIGTQEHRARSNVVVTTASRQLRFQGTGLSIEMELLRNYVSKRELSGLYAQKGRARLLPFKEPKGVLAVFIVGLLDRLILFSKITQVVEPAVLEGYQVNVYLSVAKLQDAHAFKPLDGRIQSPEAQNVSTKTCWERDNFCEVVYRAVTLAGGKLALAEVLENQIDVRSVAYADHPEIENPGRLFQYAPYVHKDETGHIVDGDESGKNVLRRFWSLEKLANRCVTNSSVPPDFLLITHDDDQWMGPLTLSNFSSRTNASRKVFSKDCNTWLGINDKTLLLGRDAASVILSRLYNGFWTQSNELDEACWSRDHTWRVRNLECYLLHWVHVQGMTSEPVDWQLLPTYTSAWMNDGTLCQRTLYSKWISKACGLDKLPKACPE